jgi:8-oxo-dGTP pyrophosphatase MutT (NUDIX family)
MSTAESSSEPAIAPLIPAATVVPLRDGPSGPEVLMLQRNAGRGAFAGFWVFPGGRVDDADADDVACAVRETEEETGLSLDGSTFARWSHWTPPITEPKRFGTWFFVAPVPDGLHVQIDDGEIVAHEWLTPQTVLDRRDAGEWSLVPPTFVTLTTLAGFTSVDAVLRFAAANDPQQYVTTLIKQDAKLIVCWPPDAALGEGASIDEPGFRHRVQMSGGGRWVYERP